MRQFVYSFNSTLIFYATTRKQKITQLIVFGSIFNLTGKETIRKEQGSNPGPLRLQLVCKRPL